ncbi:MULTISPECIES: hypothetical protein [unclassified Ruegeria]|uniref:hypothetical protein n=1 Tax=unclassified Ruegeria TaxID=2625375 RepID=UPI001487A8C8|nr:MULTISPECIES: hypothetical protein [unclassified Ruegeria]
MADDLSLGGVFLENGQKVTAEAHYLTFKGELEHQKVIMPKPRRGQSRNDKFTTLGRNAGFDAETAGQGKAGRMKRLHQRH